MPIPSAVARVNRRITNPVMRNLVGTGPFAELEHVGRRTGLVRHTVLLAFREGSTVTIALTYGPEVDWLRNIDAAGGARLRLHGHLLGVGPARRLTRREGRRRMPRAVQFVLSLIRVNGFIELPVLTDQPRLS